MKVPGGWHTLRNTNGALSWARFGSRVIGGCLLSGVFTLSGCGGSGDNERPPPELPFIFGPAGQADNYDCSATPADGAVPAGCVTRYELRPGVLEAEIFTNGVPPYGSVGLHGCTSAGASWCPGYASATLESVGTYSAELGIHDLDDVTKLCAEMYVSAPGGGGTDFPLTTYPLDCQYLPRPIKAGIGAFKVTPELHGLVLEGWAADLATDDPAIFAFRNGVSGGSPSVRITADGHAPQSLDVLPKFSADHGFTAVVPYSGAPGPTQLCVSLVREPKPTGMTPSAPVEPEASTPAPIEPLEAAPEGPQGELLLDCLEYTEPAEAFSKYDHITSGEPIEVTLPNVGAGRRVSVNLLSEGGYFLLPWSFERWTANSGPDGAATVSVDFALTPPGRYTLAFHCEPECPRADINQDGVLGGGTWEGDITLSSPITIEPARPGEISTSTVSSSIVRVVGIDFEPGEKIRLVAFPNVGIFDGPPVEASMVAYPIAGSSGTFSADLDLVGFPLSNNLTQIVAFDMASETAIASVMHRSS